MQELIKNETIIRPSGGALSSKLFDLWRYRELLLILAWRDIKVLYKQSFIGILWVVLRPLMSMAILSFIFGKVVNLPSGGIPYPVFVLLGLLPWTYFSSSLSASTTSILSSANLVSKVYFPRILIPIAANLATLVDFSISFVIVILMLIIYGIPVSAWLLLTPLMVVLLFIASVGPGMLLGALNVRYRDVGQTFPFILQIWMFLTPVIYPMEFLPQDYRMFLYLNPMVGPIETFRALAIADAHVNVTGLFISLASAVVMMMVGYFYFRKVEKTFADII